MATLVHLPAVPAPGMALSAVASLLMVAPASATIAHILPMAFPDFTTDADPDTLMADAFPIFLSDPSGGFIEI